MTPDSFIKPVSRITHILAASMLQTSKNNIPSAACPACGGLPVLLLNSPDHNRGIGATVFSYWQCLGCDMVYMDPIPNNIGDYYEGGYQEIPKDFSAFTKMADAEKYRLEPLLRYKDKGELLEIGPWIGIFSFNAKRQGFAVDAIEMNPAACTFLRDEVQITVENTNDVVEALKRSHKSYDAIVLWHSLEHLPQPWLVIKNAQQRLKPNGVLVVAIPNIKGSQAIFLKERWLHLDAPRHTHFWSPDALTKLGRSSGLKLLELTTRDRLSRNLEIMAWQHRIRTIVRIPFLRRIVGVALAPILTLLVSRRGGAGITAVFGVDRDDALVRKQ